LDWVDLGDTVLRYELSGDRGPLLVLIHEIGGALESWDAVAQTLRREFRILRYDHRGFGLSGKVRGDVHFDDLLRDLAGLLDRLGVDEPCDLTGPAFGGGFALAFAAKYPKRTHRVLACSPTTSINAAGKVAMLARADAAERNGMRSLAEPSHAFSYPQCFREGDLGRYERYRRRWLANDPSSFAAINRMLAETDMENLLGDITCPCLIVAGSHDQIRPPAMVSALVNKIPGARYHEAPTGHFMPLHTPKLFSALAVEFFGEGRA